MLSDRMYRYWLFFREKYLREPFPLEWRNEVSDIESQNVTLKEAFEARGESILANFYIDDEFRETLHRIIDEQEDGE